VWIIHVGSVDKSHILSEDILCHPWTGERQKGLSGPSGAVPELTLHHPERNG